MVCGNGYTYKNNLAFHMKKHNPGFKIREYFQCEMRGKTFVHHNSLHVHRKRHLGESKFICDICGKSLSSNDTLKFHRWIHTGEKPLICDTCGKKFSAPKYLQLHKLSHTGEHPHTCLLCGKSFTQLSTPSYPMGTGVLSWG